MGNQNWWYAWLQVEHGSIIKGDHMQIPFKLAANLWKASKSEIFVEEKFLTLALSLKDIVAGLKVLQKAFFPLMCNQ